MSARTVRYFDRVIEYGVYLYIPAMFISISLWQLALTAILLAWLVKHVVTHGRHLGYLRHPLVWIGMVFGALVLLSTSYAPDTLNVLGAYKNTIGAAMILLLAVPDVFKDERRQQRLLRLMAYSALGIVLVQFGRYVADGLTYETIQNYSHYRNMAEPLALYLPFALAAAFLSGKSSRAFLWITVVVLQLGLLLATGARGAWAGIAVALFLWLLLKPERKFVIFVTALALMALALYIWLPPGNILSKRIAEELMGGSAIERLDRLWLQTYEMIAARPLLGYGYGDYFGELNRQSAQHPEWVVYRPGPYGPHNNFLDIWFSAGIIALACLIYLYARFFGQLVATIRSSVSPLSMYFALATLCAFTTHFLVRSFVDDMNWRPLGVLMGIAVALSAVRRTADPANSI